MLLVASASRNDSTVAGMLRDAISRKVAPIFVEANSAKDEPTTVKAAVKPNARYSRERIVWSQLNEPPKRPRTAERLNLYEARDTTHLAAA